MNVGVVAYNPLNRLTTSRKKRSILGVTLCAAGTSFPNLWASVLTAREGKSSMAIANALGTIIIILLEYHYSRLI